MGDVKYKTKESKGLDKTSAELSSERTGVQAELDAVSEFLASDVLKKKVDALENELSNLAKFQEEMDEMRNDEKAIYELHRLKVGAKTGLENYCFTLRTTLQEEKNKDKFNAKLQKTVQVTLDWLDKNQLAEKDDFVDMQEELEGLVQEAAKYRAEIESVRIKIEAKTSMVELMRLGASLNYD